jgi:hypothetical protein
MSVVWLETELVALLAELYGDARPTGRSFKRKDS